MDRTNKVLLLVAILLDRWDELPNDVKDEPELAGVKLIVDQIGEVADDESEDE